MKPLLLLHGALGTAHQLQSLATLLSTERDVHTLTFSGHGDSAAPTSGGYSFETFAKDILDCMAANQLAQVDIFGYSMGGYAALYLALKYPEKVGKIATLGTKVVWTAEGSAQEVKMLNADKLEEKVPAYADKLKALHGETDWRNMLAATAQMMLDLGNSPLLKEEDYKAIQHEVLLCIGDKDQTAGLEDTVATYRLVPKAQLWVLPNTPHPLEKVDMSVLSTSLKRFFAE